MLGTELGFLYVLSHLILISIIPFYSKVNEAPNFHPEPGFKRRQCGSALTLYYYLNAFRMGEWQIVSMHWTGLLSCSALDRVSLRPDLSGRI